jgi:hypothetical protein
MAIHGVYAFHLPSSKKIKIGYGRVGFRLSAARVYDPDVYLLAHSVLDDHDERVKKEREIKKAFGIKKGDGRGELLDITPENVRLLFELYDTVGDIWYEEG